MLYIVPVGLPAAIYSAWGSTGTGPDALDFQVRAVNTVSWNPGGEAVERPRCGIEGRRSRPANLPETRYMTEQRSAQDILERHFLQVRCGLLDIAATLDRINRADGASQVANDERLDSIRRAVDILNDGDADRAERIQVLFSDPYQAGWNQ